MNLSRLREWLSHAEKPPASAENSLDEAEAGAIKPFEPEKRLCERDYVIIDMLNSQVSVQQDCNISFHSLV